jgi:hypothetical protein
VSTIKYLLDEHIDPRLRRALIRLSPGIIVWRVGDPGTPALQTTDPDILSWCEKNTFSLITNNRASMPVHLRDHLAAGRHVPGIFILNPHMTMGETADELALIWGAAEPEEYADQLRFLPVSS